MESIEIDSEPLALETVTLRVTTEPVRLSSHSFGLEALPCALDTRAAVFLQAQAFNEGGCMNVPIPVGATQLLVNGNGSELSLSVPCCSNNDPSAPRTSGAPDAEKKTHAYSLRVPVLEGTLSRAPTSVGSRRTAVPNMVEDLSVVGNGHRASSTESDDSGFVSCELQRVRFIDVTAITTQANAVIHDPQNDCISVPIIVNCFYTSMHDSGSSNRKARSKRRRVVILDDTLISASQLELVGLAAHTVGRVHGKP